MHCIATAMAELIFRDLSFEKEKDKIKVNFLRLFYTYLEENSLRKIAPFELSRNSITFEDVSEHSARKKFDFLLYNSFKNLKNRLNNKSAIYIHQSSGIPLMGTNYFGLVDRGTNIIEVKPITSCNISCIFCSVDEGPISRRKVDFIVEKDYLVNDLGKLVEFKGSSNIDAHINAQGEPTLYGDLIGLVKDIMSIKGVKTSSIDTNGLLLTKQLVDELADAGLTRINLSLHSLDPKKAAELAGHSYNLGKVLEIARYIPKTKMDLIIVPVWMKGCNDEELPKLAKFAREIGAGKTGPCIGIQNMLNYRFGRNPIEQASMDEFYAKMKELEQKHGEKLIIDKHSFKVEELPELPKPFRKGQIIEAEIVLPGRIGNEKLAVACNRLISVPSCDKDIGSTVKLRIKRTKHNIFLGEMLD
ncbi:radical SAM protein [Candidatus Woesearchaeota archaeon]|nr:radical SAM protein [Candidatus Woesearchaeota archaeon]